MKLIIGLTTVIFLAGCSTSDAARSFCDNGNDGSAAIRCIGAVATAYVMSPESKKPKQCDQLSGSAQKKCLAKADTLKSHIEQQTKKPAF